MRKYLLQSAGINPDNFSDNPEQVRRAIQIIKRAKDCIYAEAYAKLSDNQLSDNWAINVFPNMHRSMHSQGLLMLRYEPHRTDPEKCYLYAAVLALPGMDFERTVRCRPTHSVNILAGRTAFMSAMTMPMLNKLWGGGSMKI